MDHERTYISVYVRNRFLALSLSLRTFWLSSSLGSKDPAASLFTGTGVSEAKLIGLKAQPSNVNNC